MNKLEKQLRLLYPAPEWTWGCVALDLKLTSRSLRAQRRRGRLSASTLVRILRLHGSDYVDNFLPLTER